MKKALLIGVLLLGSFSACANPISSNCTYNGIPLYGKAQVVKAFADFKVQRVSAFGDLKVKYVKAFPSNCGEWELVDHFGDFTIEYVDHFGDFTIQEVDHFPGL